MSEITTNFKALNLSQDILKNLDSLGYHTMTPIQEKGLPPILSGQDFIGQANTGSGKTAVFALGILSKLDLTERMPQALVVVPTRELADQVTNEIRRLARFSGNIKVITLSGGSQERHMVKSLKQGAHVVVGTPGRLIKLLEKKVLVAFKINTLVLDEADRLLEIGSFDEINKIASFTPYNRQTMLFSATFPHGIKQLSASLQEDAAQVTIDSQHQTSSIKQIFYKVEEDKDEVLLRVLGSYNPESCLIFCNSREICNRVKRILRAKKMDSLHIHSDLEQKDRTLTLLKFANRSCRILVATDLASRGLDIKDVSMVINYDIASNKELYVHRIGRTGRAGKEGLAVSLCTLSDSDILETIGNYLKMDCPVRELEELEKIEKLKNFALSSSMTTIYISGGKKNNIRPGDILGALTKDAGLQGIDVGKIDVLDANSYVAIANEKVHQAVKALSVGKIKGKKFKVGKA